MIRTPVTYILLACLIAAFAGQSYLAEMTPAHPISDFGLEPSVFPDQPWRAVTSGFLHVDVTHLIVNSASLWALGVSLERYIGSLRFFIVYAASLLAGSAAVWMLEDPGTFTVGASGAIFGLVGAGIVAHLRFGELPLYELIVLFVGVGWAAYADAGISWQAHAGGALAGLLLGALFLISLPETTESSETLEQR